MTKLAAKGTDGTDVGTTITTQGDILYRDGSGLQRLANLLLINFYRILLVEFYLGKLLHQQF